ncbi:MAG: hypothetical protein ACI8PZ_001204 [Myxococcota bacterium]|jgi:hypothetical protein
MTRFMVALVTSALLATPALAKKGKKGGGSGGRDLAMDAGTIQLGGSATVDILSSGGSTDVVLNLAPTGGYFVVDNVELFGGIALGLGTIGTAWGFEVGGKYFVDIKPNWIYFGAGLGYGVQTIDAGIVTVSANVLNIAPQGGVLIPLGKNVGLDLGTRVNIGLSGGSTFITVPIGMLGVQAFF